MAGANAIKQQLWQVALNDFNQAQSLAQTDQQKSYTETVLKYVSSQMATLNTTQTPTPGPVTYQPVKIVELGNDFVILQRGNYTPEKHTFDSYDPDADLNNEIRSYQSWPAGTEVNEQYEAEATQYLIQIRQCENNKKLIKTIFTFHKWSTGSQLRARILELTAALVIVSGRDMKKYIKLYVDEENMEGELQHEFELNGYQQTDISHNRYYLNCVSELMKALLIKKT
jgi:hypothetical protein